MMSSVPSYLLFWCERTGLDVVIQLDGDVVVPQSAENLIHLEPAAAVLSVID